MEISENKNFTDSKIHKLGEDYSVIIYNLKTGTEYHYRMIIVLSNKKEVYFGGSFETADTPRILSVDGIYNVRDIGGWKTADGKEICRGLLYRGSELDGAVQNDYKLTDAERDEMIMNFGIRTDMDLRSPENSVPGTHVLGASVSHKYYNSSAYTEIFSESGEETMREIFSDPANLEKYPVYPHCTYGADRTGTVCYLLEAILGVGENDLIKEYELTVLVDPTHSRARIEGMIEELKTYEGLTINEKAENFLLSVGVTPEEIGSIKSIFLKETR